MGDPGGIGPEIILKALNSTEVRRNCIPIVIGDAGVMEEILTLLKLPVKLRIIKSPEESKFAKGTIELIDIRATTKTSCLATHRGMKVIPPNPPLVKGGWGDFQVNYFEKCKPTAKGGKACLSYIKRAVELALNKQVDGIVTAPISKEALKMANFKWPGHTEMFADLTNTKDYAMMLTGGPLSVILVTIHTALKNVPHLITKKKILKTIRLAQKACDMLEIKKPRIALAGLNPHAGESGIFGDEEIRKIIPAMKEAVKEGIPVSGPYPPDIIFHKAYKGKFDIIVCMYHDQGLIPLKMIAFDEGVNVTIGLPFIRTSPDHGTAYDIAWKGIANPSSMIEAIKLAARLRI
ncbi:MAG: 4-hydroxythreonine-4-phosphate dehydrogenase PdxA [Nitrospira sp.]|nr:4-hydroxythreonine-4-phosphate dehydrogenase PdxA [Nitrospira sp.]